MVPKICIYLDIIDGISGGLLLLISSLLCLGIEVICTVNNTVS